LKSNKSNIRRNFPDSKNRKQQQLPTKNIVAERKSIQLVLKKYQSFIIFIFSFLLYANTLNYGYVLDDGLMIKENKFTQKGISGIHDIFTHDQLGGAEGREASAIYQGGRYRPLSQVLFALEVQLFKLKPFFGHLVQVLMYSLLCVLIFITLKKIFLNAKTEKWYLSVPFVAAVIYAAHPIHTEVAANIKSGDEIMCMLGAMLSLYFSICYIDRKKITDLVLSFFFFLFGMFSKENAITFIAIVPLTILIFRKTNIKTYLIVILPLLAAAAAYFLVRFSVIGFSAEDVEIKELFHNPFLYATTSERYATIMLTWLKYLILLIFPHPLTHDYYPKQIPIIGWGDFRAIISVVIYAAIITFALISLKKKSLIAYGILFFLITFSVTSNLVFNLGLFMNERLMLLPSLGFIIVFALLFIKAIKIFIDRKTLNWALIGLLCFLVFFIIKTIDRNTAWKSDYVLFTTDVKTSVNSGRCNVIAGSLIVADAREEKDSAVKFTEYDKASEYLERGLEIYDGNIEGWNSLGEVSIYLGNYDRAEEALRKVLELSPLNSTALNNLLYVGQHYQDQLLDKKALDIYDYLISVRPTAAVYCNIAKIMKGSGKVDSAIAILGKAIELQPDYYDAYNQIAEYYGQHKNDYDSALSYLEEAYKRNSHYAPTLENMGIIYGIKADYKQSLFYFQKAVELDSTKASAYTNMARTYKVMGDNVKAQEYFAKAAKYSGNK
jgi:protein O-mannosyl-transferase